MSTRDDEEMEWEERRRQEEEEDEERRQERREEEDERLRQSAEDDERQVQNEAEYHGEPQEWDDTGEKQAAQHARQQPSDKIWPPVGGGGCALVMAISSFIVLVTHVLR